MNKPVAILECIFQVANMCDLLKIIRQWSIFVPDFVFNVNTKTKRSDFSHLSYVPCM